MPRKTRADRVPSTPVVSPLRVQLFRNERAREAYEKLNSKRKIWVERSVILDEVDPAIRANLESRGWLSLLEIDHPPPTTLIREFFSNLSCHISCHSYVFVRFLGFLGNFQGGWRKYMVSYSVYFFIFKHSI